MIEYWVNVIVIDAFTIFTAINSFFLLDSFDYIYNEIPATSRKYSSPASCALWLFLFSLTLPTFVSSKEKILLFISFKHSSASLYKCIWWCTFIDCGCAPVETLLVMVHSLYKSCVFRYRTRRCILPQNSWHPRMHIRSTNKIVRYLVWISFSAALVKTS